jgi:hypothetical protein
MKKTAIQLPPQSEKEFQSMVIQLARLNCWTVTHFRPARTLHGWATPVEADGAGFPDLVLTRTLINHRTKEVSARLLFVECKRNGAYPTAAQQSWLDALRHVRGVEVHLLRPEDWPFIETLLA